MRILEKYNVFEFRFIPFSGQEGSNYAQYTNETGHLRSSHRPSVDFVLADEPQSVGIESGDRVTLVDREGKESPVIGNL